MKINATLGNNTFSLEADTFTADHLSAFTLWVSVQDNEVPSAVLTTLENSRSELRTSKRELADLVNQSQESEDGEDHGRSGGNRVAEG
jgi:hypothetical protein